MVEGVYLDEELVVALLEVEDHSDHAGPRLDQVPPAGIRPAPPDLLVGTALQNRLDLLDGRQPAVPVRSDVGAVYRGVQQHAPALEEPVVVLLGLGHVHCLEADLVHPRVIELEQRAAGYSGALADERPVDGEPDVDLLTRQPGQALPVVEEGIVGAGADLPFDQRYRAVEPEGPFLDSAVVGPVGQLEGDEVVAVGQRCGVDLVLREVGALPGGVLHGDPRYQRVGLALHRLMKGVQGLYPQAPVPDVHGNRDGQRTLAHVDRGRYLLRSVVVVGLVGNVEQGGAGRVRVEDDDEVPG